MADYWTSFSVLFPVGAGNVGAALALYGQLEAELEADGETIGFAAQKDDPGDDATVWLWDNSGSGDPEHVITYALRCAEAFNLSGLWGFQFGLSCSRPRLDGFGGGAQVLDLGQRKSLAWLDTAHWLGKRLDKGEIPVAPVETILRPVAEGRGWDHHAQASVLLGFIDGLTADDPAVAERLRAHLAKTCGVDGSFKCRGCGAEAFVSNAGTTHHWGLSPDGIDHAQDRNHVAVPGKEAQAVATLKGTGGMESLPVLHPDLPGASSPD